MTDTLRPPNICEITSVVIAAKLTAEPHEAKTKYFGAYPPPERSWDYQQVEERVRG
ncbi:hypothetical protein EYZ11_011372 [Aspergillus tanneri]|uniref:Uncharacterized protein n=1 Tax=Aspergillus tanneri TaxID=1220188 RepID=A0A4S3J3B7_9EURO|nr:hypothetical protein EYZ11_011372 [Aspergillus tanneri]